MQVAQPDWLQGAASAPGMVGLSPERHGGILALIYIKERVAAAYEYGQGHGSVVKFYVALPSSLCSHLQLKPFAGALHIPLPGSKEASSPNVLPCVALLLPPHSIFPSVVAISCSYATLGNSTMLLEMSSGSGPAGSTST